MSALPRPLAKREATVQSERLARVSSPGRARDSAPRSIGRPTGAEVGRYVEAGATDGQPPVEPGQARQCPTWRAIRHTLSSGCDRPVGTTKSPRSESMSVQAEFRIEDQPHGKSPKSI